MSATRSAVVAASIAMTLLISGCATVSTVAGAPTPTRSDPTSASAPATTPTPTPRATSDPQVERGIATVPMPDPAEDESNPPPVTRDVDPPALPPAIDPAAPAAPESPPLPDPNSVDPALYPSHAIDTVNGDVPLPGVEFSAADGQIICGIMTSGHFSTAPGFASCTVSTYRELFPQPTPQPPYVQSILTDPNYGPAFLYPDWFAQPARSIPVLPAGKVIHFEGTACSAESGGVRCVSESDGRGFFVTTTSHQMFS